MNIIALPILIPFAIAISLLAIRSSRLSRWIGTAGSFVMLGVAIFLNLELQNKSVMSLNTGGWIAPFGIVLVIDYLSSFMLIASSLIAFVISIFANRILSDDIPFSRFYFFFFTLNMGVNGAFITGDVFNLYVWFEVMLISSFVLVTIGKKKEQLEGGIKYLALNILGSMLFLAGLGLLYGKTGTLNMAHLAEILKNNQDSNLMNTSSVLFFVAFGIKAGVFPLYFWLPSSYHTPNIAITSLFAGLLTKVGVYSLIRFFTLFFVQDQAFWHNLLLIIAGITMVTGGMAAASYYETRRILSYHIISQIGYMIMGLGIFTPLAVAGAIFFTVHNMIAKTGTFIAAGLIAKIKGTYELKEVGGLYKQNPALAILFIIPAFALAGFPPVSGFFAKFMLLKAGIESEQYLITAVALLTGFLTLYSMIKIWNEAFLKKQPESTVLNTGQKLKFSDYLPLLILASASLFMGIFAVDIFDYVMQAGNQLLEPSAFIKAVLNQQ